MRTRKRWPHTGLLTLKGPSVVKEICIGITLGLFAGGLWKMHHWNEQRKIRSFYEMLEKGEISRWNSTTSSNECIQSLKPMEMGIMSLLSLYKKKFEELGYEKLGCVVEVETHGNGNNGHGSTSKEV
ncbi:hypothetical protein HPP92_013055 [Vanilla planifolia]|uniref:Cytochrome c oxidase subunit 5C n=1 Tax=Vanilla planifolia TaxID=51239 RepID=A0A835QWD0_VANPL|nr:hypothetical protein HPP92_013055 [Vanilla planifolia]